jgi:hypothetical protein
MTAASQPVYAFVRAFPAGASDQAAQTSDLKSVMAIGGLSPDGRLEVRVLETETPAPSNYVVALVDRAAGRVVAELTRGGYFSYADVSGDLEERSALRVIRVRWHQGSRFVAITDAGTTDRRALYVFAVMDDGAVAPLRLPEYERDALRLVGAPATIRRAVTDLDVWNGDVLQASLTLRIERPSHVLEQFMVPFSIRLIQDGTNAPRLVLDRMVAPSQMPCC